LDAVRRRAEKTGRKPVAPPAAAAYSALHRRRKPAVFSAPSKEITMNRSLTAQAVSFSLALVVTVTMLMALNGLASTEHAAQQQQIAAAKTAQA
jgi:hypothetical protein